MMRLWLISYVLVGTTVAAQLGQELRPAVSKVYVQLEGIPRFLSPMQGFVMTPGGLMSSDDGGRSWKLMSTPPRTSSQVDLQASFLKDGTVVVFRSRLFVGPTLESILISSDHGAIWRSVAPPQDSEFFADGVHAVADRGDIWLGGSRDTPIQGVPKHLDCRQSLKDSVLTPVIYWLRSGEPKWIEQRLPIENGCPLHLLEFPNAPYGVAVSGSAVFFTENGGSLWRRSTLRAVGRLPEGLPSRLRFLDADPSYGWLSYADGFVFSTSDGGKTWLPMAAPGSALGRGELFGPWGELELLGKAAGFVIGDHGVLFYTRDAGRTWSKVNLPEPVDSVTCSYQTCWVRGWSRALYSFAVGISQVVP